MLKMAVGSPAVGVGIIRGPPWCDECLLSEKTCAQSFIYSTHINTHTIIYSHHKASITATILPPYLAQLEDVDDGLAEPDTEGVVGRSLPAPAAHRGASGAVGRGVLAGGRRLSLRRGRVVLSGNVAV